MDRLRAVLVGAGAMGKGWADNLRNSDEVEWVGWADVDADVLKRSQELLDAPGVDTDTDFLTLIDRHRPDFIVDVTPPEAHRVITTEALAKGVPVLGEKPMANSMEAAREMVQAADRAGKLYMVSQSRRYHHGIEAFRQVVRERVGHLAGLYVDFFLGPRFGGFREEMTSPLLIDMAIHTFDQARFISGQDSVRVYCDEFNPKHSWFKGNAAANAIFEMADGSRFVYRGSWVAEGLPTSWEGAWRATGSRGSATWNGSEFIEADTRNGEEFERHEARPSPEGYIGSIGGSLREFCHALRTGETPNGECHDNIKSLAMVFAAVRSAQLGTPVTIEGDKIS
jgi:predicted dehydrogenase